MTDPRREDRLWQAGFLVGSAIGAAVTVLGRRAEQSARKGLIDWNQAERVAIGRLRKAPGALDPAELRRSEASYTAAMAVVVPRLAEALGTELPGIVDRVGVVDRAGWVRANSASFADLIGRLEGQLLDQVVPKGGGLLPATMAIANRWVTTHQIGYLLGFMGGRVLGQYDLALLAAETTPGRLLFVEENIRQTAKLLDVPVDPFRTWIALHETTHAFEFEAHPWLRPYLADRLERQLSAFSKGAASLSRDGLKRLGRSLRGEGGAENWMERLMDSEQRRLFRETQAVMSLLEGFSDYVMDEYGKDLVPGIEQISQRFHARRDQKKTGV
ncbi:MAG: zinc-dependent metalloprotease, partial [Candidatus Limnocylindrales bacterium]